MYATLNPTSWESESDRAQIDPPGQIDANSVNWPPVIDQLEAGSFRQLVPNKGFGRASIQQKPRLDGIRNGQPRGDKRFGVLLRNANVCIDDRPKGEKVAGRRSGEFKDWIFTGGLTLQALPPAPLRPVDRPLTRFADLGMSHSLDRPGRSE